MTTHYHHEEQKLYYSIDYSIDVGKLEDLHSYGRFLNLPCDHGEIYWDGCIQCHKPWPCQIIRLAWALKAAQERIAELEAK